MADALATAQNAEARLDQLSQEIRALQHATATGTGQENAQKEMGAQGGAGLAPPSSIAGIEKGAKAPADSVNAAEQQIQGMVARAQRILDQAQMQEGTAASRFVDRMVRLAHQEQGGKQADLSGFMTENARSSGQTTVRGRVPGDPDYVLPPPPPALPGGSIQAIPGRRVTGSGAPVNRWMYVDTWYAVGPFPNPARKNIDMTFPPETLVDLDAAYPGKDGRTVKWQFWQTNSPEMVPPNAEEYAIYYFYTELYFDQPRDAWIAVGSDDQSTIWLNSQLIWKSSAQLKGWQIGEGLRRVHFNRGFNPVLVRLENGWRGTAVSLVVALQK